MNKTPVATPIAVANYFIKKARRKGGIYRQKLEMLVYFAHGWCLGCNDRPLIDESVMAWPERPVIETIFTSAFSYDLCLITDLMKDFDRNGLSEEKPQITDPYVRDFLDSIWNQYSKYDWVQLVRMACPPDSPWYQIVHDKNYKPRPDIEIPDEMLRQYFFDPNPIEIPKRNGILERVFSLR